ncbi:DDE-type integrase/transposase/recombinase [Salmonella enterica subsp. enterica]|nr:DDE-type integrase/transposase/recombinase [Salmonella enterica subsp. enterica]
MLQLGHGTSCREAQEMLEFSKRRNVDHLFWPLLSSKWKWPCWYRRKSLPIFCPWHMDETYVKVNGRWAYLYRGHCCKVSDEAAFCLIQRPYISKKKLCLLCAFRPGITIIKC